MILTRLSRAFREQNWFAVAIEFVIVILGVVVGFQVTGWANARADLSSERRHLEEIADDLRTDLVGYDRGLTSAAQRMAAARYILLESRGEVLPDELVLATATLPVPELPDPSSLDLDHLLGGLNLVQQNAVNRSGFDALVNSGNLSLIRNRNLAGQIQQYYSAQVSVELTMSIFRDVRNDGVAQFYRLGFSTFGSVPAEQLIAAAREDVAFAAYVRSMDEWAIVSTRVFSRERDSALVLLAALEDELEASR